MELYATLILDIVYYLHFKEVEVEIEELVHNLVEKLMI